jgi:cytochrome oxidase Cu insertion factor (SCO1/SenC/PrrC family)
MEILLTNDNGSKLIRHNGMIYLYQTNGLFYGLSTFALKKLIQDELQDEYKKLEATDGN